MKKLKGRFGYYLSYHINQKKFLYLGFLISLLLGIILGIVFHLTNLLGAYVISDNDQQIFDFITKNASILDFFFSKLLDIFIAFLLIFICSLSIYSSLLVFVFFAYQGMIFSSICCQIITSYGVLGVLNVFVVLLPINVILFLFLFYESAICVSRASTAKRYNIDFKNSFAYERGFFKQLLVCFMAAIIFVFIVSIILSIALRAVAFVAY